jgi:hypothetical protein
VQHPAAVKRRVPGGHVAVRDERVALLFDVALEIALGRIGE